MWPSLFITVAFMLLGAVSGNDPPSAGGTYLTLSDGKRIPGIALGTYPGFPPKPKEIVQGVSTVEKAVSEALQVGYRHIDTATIYDTEDDVGKAIQKAIKSGLIKREDVFVTTKLWNTDHKEEDVLPALRASLARLGLEYVNLYLVHWPISTTKDNKFNDIDYLETWRGMEMAHKLGLAKSIGVSNFNTTQLNRLYDAATIKPVVNQIEVNPSFANQQVVKESQRLGLKVMAYSPLGNLVSRGEDSKTAPPPRIDDPTLVAIARNYNKTTPQIVLRYLVDRGLIPIPKSTNPKRIRENFDIFDFKLTDAEVETINKFDKHSRVVNPSFWQDSPNYPFEKTSTPIDNPF